MIYCDIYKVEGHIPPRHSHLHLILVSHKHGPAPATSSIPEGDFFRQDHISLYSGLGRKEEMFPVLLSQMEECQVLLHPSLLHSLLLLWTSIRNTRSQDHGLCKCGRNSALLLGHPLWLRPSHFRLHDGQLRCSP